MLKWQNTVNSQMRQKISRPKTNSTWFKQDWRGEIN